MIGASSSPDIFLNTQRARGAPDCWIVTRMDGTTYTYSTTLPGEHDADVLRSVA